MAHEDTHTQPDGEGREPLPPYERQELRSQLDKRVYDAVQLLSTSNADADVRVKGYSIEEQGQVSTSYRVTVTNGFTYEVEVRVVAWPGMDAEVGP